MKRSSLEYFNFQNQLTKLIQDITKEAKDDRDNELRQILQAYSQMLFNSGQILQDVLQEMYNVIKQNIVQEPNRFSDDVCLLARAILGWKVSSNAQTGAMTTKPTRRRQFKPKRLVFPKQDITKINSEILANLNELIGVIRPLAERHVITTIIHIKNVYGTTGKIAPLAKDILSKLQEMGFTQDIVDLSNEILELYNNLELSLSISHCNNTQASNAQISSLSGMDYGLIQVGLGSSGDEDLRNAELPEQSAACVHTVEDWQNRFTSNNSRSNLRVLDNRNNANNNNNLALPCYSSQNLDELKASLLTLLQNEWTEKSNLQEQEPGLESQLQRINDWIVDINAVDMKNPRVNVFEQLLAWNTAWIGSREINTVIETILAKYSANPFTSVIKPFSRSLYISEFWTELQDATLSEEEALRIAALRSQGLDEEIERKAGFKFTTPANM